MSRDDERDWARDAAALDQRRLAEVASHAEIAPCPLAQALARADVVRVLTEHARSRRLPRELVDTQGAVL